MQPAIVRILHPLAADGAGPPARALAEARRANAERLEARFAEAGAADVRIEEGLPDGRHFGARLRDLTGDLASGHGLVVLGSGSIPLAPRRHLADLLAAASSGERRALANSFFSADVVGIGDASNLASVPDLPSDNGLPRWLRDEAGYRVDVMRGGARLAMDIDSPLDLVILDVPANLDDAAVRERIDGLRRVTQDSSAELVVSGRTSAATLRWLERHTASRTRAFIEERGLRSIALGAGAGGRQRAPRSVLGLLLEERGAAALGSILGELGDAAIVDTRVLLAHRHGADEASWPSADDRYASDLLLPGDVVDPWLRALTASAREAAIPVLLGGHTLVGPGVRRIAVAR